MDARHALPSKVAARPALRVVACDVRGLRGPDLTSLANLIRPLGADVVVVAGGPWRIRARSRAAALADRFNLFHGGGGAASVGNLVLVSARVSVPETWSVQFPLVPGHRMRAAALARCVVPGGSFVVAATELAANSSERAVSAVVLAQVLSTVDEPVIVVGNVAGTVVSKDLADAGADGRSASSRTEAGSILVGPEISVRARHYARRSRPTGRLPIMADLLLP